MRNVLFETYLERKNSGNYFDTKFTDIAYFNVNLHEKAVKIAKLHYPTE